MLVQSSEYRRETAVDWKERRGTEGAQRLCTYERAINGTLFIITGDIGAYVHVTAGSHIFIEYHCEQKELLQRGFVTEEVKNRPSSVSVGHG